MRGFITARMLLLSVSGRLRCKPLALRRETSFAPRNKKTYQMDPANSREALIEAYLDSQVPRARGTPGRHLPIGCAAITYHRMLDAYSFYVKV